MTWHTTLFDDPPSRAEFGMAAMLADFADFEAALTIASAELGIIDAAEAAAALDALQGFSPDAAAIDAAVTRDGVPVPEYVRQLKRHAGEPAARVLHRGATSQDLMDTHAVRALARIADRLCPAISRLSARLSEIDGDREVMGVTRMQPALPMRLATRRDAWIRSIAAPPPPLPPLQLGGAVGDRRGLDGKGDALAEAMAARLGLSHGPCWHVDRGPIVAYGDWLGRMCGALGKVGQDVALMAAMGSVAIEGGGTSSAMPHKSNPVQAEALVTIARLAAGHVGTLHHAQVFELERSGSAWALEWIALPELAVLASVAVRTATDLVDRIVFR